MKNNFRYIWLALCVFTALFIFSNSIQPATVSSANSNIIVNFIRFIFNITTEEGRLITVYIVRKCAHIAEFAAFAFFLSMYFKASGKKFSFYFIYVLFFGLLTACTDEFIQLFSDGRSGEIKDAFIDFSGIIIGLLCSLPTFRKKEKA